MGLGSESVAARSAASFDAAPIGSLNAFCGAALRSSETAASDPLRIRFELIQIDPLLGRRSAFVAVGAQKFRRKLISAAAPLGSIAETAPAVADARGARISLAFGLGGSPCFVVFYGLS